jgi:phosphatidylglycerol lysyltransferase
VAPVDPIPADPDHPRVLALLKRHGWGAASFQTLGPGFRYWFAADGDACLAYVDTGRAWVVGGLPIADQDRYPELATAFSAEARRQDRRVCFVTFDPRFAEAVGMATICFGEMPIWDPQRWPAVVAGSRRLKEQLRRARAKGVTVRLADSAEVQDTGSPLRHAMVAVVQAWLAGRRAPPLRFLAQVEPFRFAAERRYFLAEQKGNLIAFLVLVPVYARQGWMVETIFRSPGTPNGLAEALVDAAMTMARQEGSPYLTLGAVPLSLAVNKALRAARWLASPLYNFDGLYAFKSRLRPQVWEPIHIAIAKPESRLLAFWDVAMAFAPADKRRLAISLIHAYRRPILRLLTVLLIPWTILLAMVPTEPWFPSQAVQLGWTAFDLLLILLLSVLLRHWRRGLVTLLACLTAADGVLTAWQAWAYNWQRAEGVLTQGVVVLAICGPWLTSLYLWLVRGRR